MFKVNESDTFEGWYGQDGDFYMIFLLIFSMKLWWTISTARSQERSQGSTSWVVPKGALVHSRSSCIATKRRHFALMGTHFSWPGAAHPVPEVSVQILSVVKIRGSALRHSKDLPTVLSLFLSCSYVCIYDIGYNSLFVIHEWGQDLQMLKSVTSNK